MPETSALETAAGEAGAGEPEPTPATNWWLYGLGLALQCLLWFLIFFAIVVAVATGGHVTEFRYVGF